MANYFARIELHSAAYNDYEVLHTSMQNRGFQRTIRSDEGVTYQLPTGTYVGNLNSSLLDAVNAAQKAANETGKTSWVLVLEWTSARWNLQVI